MESTEANKKIPQDLFDLLVAAERELGFHQGFKMLFGPWATLDTADVAFLSLNPGRAPDNAEMRVVSDERGNSYYVEQEITRSPITAQFLGMAKFLGVQPGAILTGVVAPFRSNNWKSLPRLQREGALEIGRQFWLKPLQRPTLRLIITCSNEAAAMACAITDAILEEEISSGWGGISIRGYRTPDGRSLVHLPHLSRFRLFGRPASEEPLRRIFELKQMAGRSGLGRH
jgi:hypothetical protein